MADQTEAVRAQLQAWMQADDVEAQAAALNAIVSTGPAALEPLLAALDDPEPGLRQGAIRALVALARANIGDAAHRSLEPFTRSLMIDTDAHVRVAAADGLRVAPPGAAYRQAVEALTVALGDDDPAVRKTAALTLAKKMERSATDSLAGLIVADPVPEVRGAAAAALAHLDYAAIQHLGDSAVAALISELANPAVPPTYSIRALGMLRAADAVGPLLDLLGTDNRPQTRREVCVALGNIGDQGAIPALERIRDSDADPAVRQAATDALHGLGVE